jgi:Sec-independent protein translocase protein TatA
MKGKAWIVISAISLLVFVSAPQPLLAQDYLGSIMAALSMQNTDLQQFQTQQAQQMAQQQATQMQRWQIQTDLNTKISSIQQQLQAQKQQTQTYEKWNQYIKNQQPQKAQKDALLVNPKQGQNLNKQSQSLPGKVQLASRQNQLSLSNQPSMVRQATGINQASMARQATGINQASMARQAPMANRAFVANRASMVRQTPRINQVSMANRASVVSQAPPLRQPRR